MSKADRDSNTLPDSHANTHSDALPDSPEDGYYDPNPDAREDLHDRPHASVRIHPAARPWHCLQDIKDMNTTLFAPEFQAAYEGGECQPCGGSPEGFWVYYDRQAKEGAGNEYVLFAAADPAYQARLARMWDEQDCTGSTADHAAPHAFEPAPNAQAIRDALPRDASLKEAVDALLKTCKGCAELYFGDP